MFGRIVYVKDMLSLLVDTLVTIECAKSGDRSVVA